MHKNSPLLHCVVALFVLLGTTAIGQTINRQNARPSKNPPPTTPEQDLEEATRLNAEAVKSYKAGEYDAALVAAQRAVQLREKVLGGEDKLLKESLANLAVISFVKQNYAGAIQLLQRLIQLDEKFYGVNSLEMAGHLQLLATCNFYIAEYKTAETAFLRALAIRENKQPADLNATAETLQSLAGLYARQGKFEKALPYYQRFLPIKEKTLQSNQPEIVPLLSVYACLLELNNQPDKAAESWQRANNVYRSLSADTPLLEAENLQKLAIEKVQPPYPEIAKSAGLRGRVFINLLINEEGKVVMVQTLCGHDILAQEAMEAVRKWRFQPTVVNGKAVKVAGRLIFAFPPQ